MELYTSLVRLKQAMNGGTLPAMTPLTNAAKAIVKPEFTIGMGALREDVECGLQCPVCGEYRQRLSRHIDMAHDDIGGSNAVKRALSIPVGAILETRREHEKRREKALQSNGLARSKEEEVTTRRLFAASRPDVVRRRGRAIASTRRSVGFKNLRNACEEQLRHRMIDLQNKIGRSPSIADAEAELGRSFVNAVKSTFGNWNAAKTRFGLELCLNRRRDGKYGYGSRVDREAALEALRAWHDVHGALPSAFDGQRRHRAPLLPHHTMIQRAMGTKSWPEAMRRAASILNIYGGRYGLPEKRQAS